MLYLLMENGSHKELPKAFSAVVRNGELFCLDRADNVTAHYSATKVTAYGQNPALRASAFSEEMAAAWRYVAPLSLGTSPHPFLAMAV